MKRYSESSHCQWYLNRHKICQTSFLCIIASYTKYPRCFKFKPQNKYTYENYRPVANLPFLSKVIEKAIAIQIHKHLSHKVSQGCVAEITLLPC